MNTNQIYESYRNFARTVGAPVLSKEIYEREVIEHCSESMGFNRWGTRNDLLMHEVKKLRRAFVLRIADALGVTDEVGMLRSLGLTGADGRVTIRGKKVSRERIIDGVSYRLWDQSRVGKMLGKAEAAEPEPETAATFAEPEPEVLELLSNAALDALATPEPEPMEAVA